jgi:hypothetical protein
LEKPCRTCSVGVFVLSLWVDRTRVRLPASKKKIITAFLLKNLTQGTVSKIHV